MKRILLMCVLLCANACADVDTWEGHWISGLNHHKANDFNQAIYKFTLAIDAIQNENENEQSHIFIFIDRAKAHMQKREWHKAIQDLNIAINCPTILKKDLCEAVKFRWCCHSMVDNKEKGLEDYDLYNSLDPSLPKYEYTKKHQIVRHISSWDKKDKEMIYDMWITLGLCSNLSDIHEYEDVIIVDLKKDALTSCPCPCEQEPDGVEQ